MDEFAGIPALERIDRALSRIERETRRQRQANDALFERHAALRARMAEAVAALDDVIARETGAGGTGAGSHDG